MARANGGWVWRWQRVGAGRQALRPRLCTKTGTRSRPYDYSADATRWSIDESLRILKTDYLDVVHIHDPDRIEQALGPGRALEALQELKRQGVVRHIGLGVRGLDLHCAFHETGCCEASLTYRDYSLLSQTAAERLLPSAERFGVGLLNAQMVRHGLLGGDEPAVVEQRFSGRPGFQPGDISYIEPWKWSAPPGSGTGAATAISTCWRSACSSDCAIRAFPRR